MIEGIAVYIVTMIVMLAIASAVILGFALHRRSADQWKDHLKSQSSQEIPTQIPEISVREENMRNVLDSSRSSRGYMVADGLPGFEAVEAMTERIEDIASRRGSHAKSRPRQHGESQSGASSDVAPTEKA